MALFEVEDGRLRKIENVSFREEEIHERRDLQKWLRENPSALGEELLVIAEEYGDWEGSKRRIDLLALDLDSNLVVIELKRTDDGGHMDLQAIRYAAMVSAMTSEDVIRAHQAFLDRHGLSGIEPRERIAAFLGLGSDDAFELSNVPRIMLVGPDFSLEITTTVLWLADRGLDIRCVRAVPYKIGERMVLDLRQLLPLKEASSYQVKLRQKDENIRLNLASGKVRERTIPTLLRNDVVTIGTEIEVVPMALPKTEPNEINVFRARIVDPASRDSIEWLHDGERYSPTALTRKLWQEFGVEKLMNNIFVHWRVVGTAQSMWDHAEELTRGERIKHTGV